MRVVVFGGTGFVGSVLVALLTARGHEVTVLTRKADGAARIEAMGARPLVGDLLAPADLRSRLGTADAMALLAAPRLFGKRLTERRFRAFKQEITTIYRNGLDLAAAAGCPIVITGGTAFQTRGDEIADESWPLARIGATRIGEGIDPLVEAAVASGSPKLAWLMPGQIYGPGGMFLKMYEWARRGRGAVLGDGSNCLPRVHVDDCAAAYAAALERIDELKTGERFIIADDVACTSREFSDYLADLLGRPHPKAPPAFMVKLIIGKLLYQTATMNCRVSNAKAKRLLGWTLRYPGYREGLKATVAAIEQGVRLP
jgi:nucleoside-diphosphate-sugar epimerase